MYYARRVINRVVFLTLLQTHGYNNPLLWVLSLRLGILSFISHKYDCYESIYNDRVTCSIFIIIVMRIIHSLVTQVWFDSCSWWVGLLCQVIDIAYAYPSHINISNNIIMVITLQVRGLPIYNNENMIQKDHVNWKDSKDLYLYRSVSTRNSFVVQLEKTNLSDFLVWNRTV